MAVSFAWVKRSFNVRTTEEREEANEFEGKLRNHPKQGEKLEKKRP